MAIVSVVAFSLALTAASYSKMNGSSTLFAVFALCTCITTEVVLLLAYHSFIHRWLISSTKVLPYPKDTPFLTGNIGPFLSEPWGFPLARWQKSIPDTKSGFYRVFLGPFDYVIPKSAKSVTTVMMQPYVFEKPAAIRDGLVESLGVGLVSAEGEVHRRQKRLLTPIFGLDRNRQLVPQIYSKAVVLREQMELMVKEAGGTKVLYMHPLTMATALDIIGITTLGVDFDSLRRPDQPFLRAYQAVFPSFEKQTLLAKFLGAVLPALVSPRTLLKLPLPLIKKFHWGMATLRQFCIEQIRTKKEEIQGSEVENKDVRQKDILSAMLSAGMTDELELTSHLLTILAAGHESTAITLAWAVFKLAQLPHVQNQLREEISSTTSSMISEVPTLEIINSMAYLRCFLMEILRMYPAFPAMMREAKQSVTVEDLTIPAGKRLMVSPWAVNHSIEMWGDDADEFRVERWQEDYNGGARSAQAFFTFSSGPRICIGKDFAILSLKIALFALVSRFVFEEAVPGWHPPIQKGTSLKPMGLNVKVSVIGA